MRPAVTVAAHVNKQSAVAATGAAAVKVLSLIRMIYVQNTRHDHRQGRGFPQRMAACWGQATALVGNSVTPSVSGGEKAWGSLGKPWEVGALYIRWDDVFYCFTHIWSKGTKTQTCSLNPTWRFKIGSGFGSLVAISNSRHFLWFVLYLCYSFW